jgi:DNA-directed RNA polymerase subunit beta'
MFKELPSPSKISLILDVPYKKIEQVIYFVNYIVLDNAGSPFFKNKEVVDLTDKTISKENRIKLRKILKEIATKVKVDSLEHRRANQYFERLENSALPFSIDELFNFIKAQTGIQFGIGAEAIYELLKSTDLEAEYNFINNELNNNTTAESVVYRKQIRRLETIKWFIESKNKPE